MKWITCWGDCRTVYGLLMSGCLSACRYRGDGSKLCEQTCYPDCIHGNCVRSTTDRGEIGTVAISEFHKSSAAHVLSCTPMYCPSFSCISMYYHVLSCILMYHLALSCTMYVQCAISLCSSHTVTCELLYLEMSPCLALLQVVTLCKKTIYATVDVEVFAA